MSTAYDDLWFAVGHLRAAKTKMADARLNHRQLSSVLYDLLRLEAREIFKIEQKLIAHAKAIQADEREAAEAKRNPPASAPRARGAA